MTGAVSHGGPCFPRDNIARATLGDEIGANAGLARAADTYNTEHTEWLIGEILSQAKKEARSAAVIGLSYRPGDAHNRKVHRVSCRASAGGQRTLRSRLRQLCK